MEAKSIVAWLKKGEAKKVLVFGNSRRRTHSLALALYRLLEKTRWGVYLHIGILSREEREKVESAMKEKPYGICVATSTLEVGIDIGDIDSIILADVPPSVNAFLQRIGRGNRRSNVCRVIGLTSEPGSQEKYDALLDCARAGELDDWHEYDRPSVRFQQLLSISWKATRSGLPLNRDKLIRMAGGSGFEHVVDDMLLMGALRDFDGALVPSDRLMDEGDQRRVHSVIVSGGGSPIVDVVTGQELASIGDSIQRGDVVFAGTAVHKVVGKDHQGAYVSKGSSEDRKEAVIPSAFGGGIRGTSRNVVWAIARRRGHDPRHWERRDGKLLTWGGAVFNQLMAAVLEHQRIARNVKCDEFGLDLDLSLTPREVRDLIQRSKSEMGLPLTAARRFHQATRYFKRLGKETQARELRASIPYESALRWLDECSEA